ncbi:MAG: glycosyltransferase [Syntrophorhabdaceae bacterium]
MTYTSSQTIQTNPSIMKTNILFILQTFRTGGSERVVVDLCRLLDPEKFTCTVAAFVDGAFRKTLKDMGVGTFLLSMRSARQDGFRVMRRISDFVASNGIDVINAHHFTPFFYSVYGAKMNRCRIYFTAHSRNEVETMPRQWSFLVSALLRISDGAIGISPEISQSIKAVFGMPEASVITLTNAIDHTRFLLPVDRNVKKKELGISETDKVIGCIGNLRKDKNYPNLIEAFKLAHDSLGGNIKLVIAGEGKRRQDLEDLIERLGLEGKVLLLGARADVPEIMKIMDVYCLSSLREGLPLSLLEAMSAGLPCVGTNVRGIRDVIADGDTGILVPSEDPEKLSQALVRVLTDAGTARRLADRGRKYVMKEHGLEGWIGNYEKLFSRKGA